MKTDFNINVQVNLGVTPELVGLVETVLTARHQAFGFGPTPATMPEQHSQSETEQPAKDEAKPSKEVSAKTPKQQQAQEEKSQAKANEQPVKEPAAETKPEGPKQYTEEDVREAMHRTRQRIEGQDYKEHTDSEAYKKYHRQLTATFKNIAALLGSDKPSTLPAEQRASFISQCDELQIMDDGTIGTPAAF